MQHFAFRSNDFMATWTQARQIRANDVEMVSVGVGNNLNMRELEVIASSPVDDNVVMANGFGSLSDSVNTVLDAVCNSEYCAQAPAHVDSRICAHTLM